MSEKTTVPNDSDNQNFGIEETISVFIITFIKLCLGF